MINYFFHNKIINMKNNYQNRNKYMQNFGI